MLPIKDKSLGLFVQFFVIHSHVASCIDLLLALIHYLVFVFAATWSCNHAFSSEVPPCLPRGHEAPCQYSAEDFCFASFKIASSNGVVIDKIGSLM